MAVTQTDTATQRRGRTAPFIDCDVHNALRSRADLKRYLPARWNRYLDQGLPYASNELLTIGALPAPDFYRRDSVPASGPPGSDFELMRAQLLDEYGVERAILHPIGDLVGLPLYGEDGLAMCAALNDWMVAEWLERDPRLWGAISIPFEDGERSVREIERQASERRFVKVTLTIKSREGLGHQKYWPIYEAAESCGLPIAAHVGGFSGTGTAASWPRYHAEWITGHPVSFATQVLSLVYSGVFDRFPRLQFVVEEGGLGWLPPLMWRMDRTWEAMREDVPHLERRPSEVVREHFWIATQPLEQPRDLRHLAQLIAHVGMDERIVFATDYPHWNFDNPTRVLPQSVLSAELIERIRVLNARTLFARAAAA